jgi:mRNA interferase MazF
MPTFEQGDVVRVPFPYTNRETTQHRPALVISDGPIASGMLLWVLMITSVANRGWPGDVGIESGSEHTGLPAPSMIRTAKIATIEAAAAQRIGSIAQSELDAVMEELSKILPLR